MGGSSHRSRRYKRQRYTADLYRLADWLTDCEIEADWRMESTGVYWIPLFGVLEAGDLRRARTCRADKWLQQLHTYGLLSGAFRPEAGRCLRIPAATLHAGATPPNTSSIMQKALPK